MSKDEEYEYTEDEEEYDEDEEEEYDEDDDEEYEDDEEYYEENKGIDKKWLACCGLIIVIAIIAFLSGGIGNNNNTTQDSLPRLNASPDKGDYFYYYGEDTPAGKTYTYAVVVNGTPYYLDDKQAEALAHNDPSIAAVIQYDLNKYDGRYSPKQYVVGSSGVHFVFDGNKSEKDTTMFEFKIMKPFEFSYSNGNTVGLNKNATRVSKIYDLNGTEIKT